MNVRESPKHMNIPGLECQGDELEQGVVALLYLLMRDEVPTGAIAKIVRDIQDARVRGVTCFCYSSEHLSMYAQELMERLKAPAHEHGLNQCKTNTLGENV